MAVRRTTEDSRTPEQRAADESALREFEAGRFLNKERKVKTIETWQDVINQIVTVKGFPDVKLRIKHVHGDLNAPQMWDDLRPAYGRPTPAVCVCEVVEGEPPRSWVPCTPWGHYRVAAKDLVFEGEADV